MVKGSMKLGVQVLNILLLLLLLAKKCPFCPLSRAGSTEGAGQDGWWVPERVLSQIPEGRAGRARFCQAMLLSALSECTGCGGRCSKMFSNVLLLFFTFFSLSETQVSL